jgi:hypothetical protein
MSNPDGNARLTALVGAFLLAPVAVEVATILLGVHSFMSWHVFFGLALIPVVVLKLASTGWRFARYYTRSEAYVAHGAPQLAMRLLAPVFVAGTVVLFASGIAMGLLHGHALVVARQLHGPASVVWLVLFGLHALVYLRQALTGSRRELLATRPYVAGRRARAWLLAAAAVCGVVVGAATVPAQHRWVSLRRDHRERRRAYSSRPISSASHSSPLARR